MRFLLIKYTKRVVSAPLLLTASLSAGAVYAEPEPIAQPHTVEPLTEVQIAQRNRGYGMFIHFGINTFNQVEWSDGKLPISSYNPTKLDPGQWVKIAKQAGFRYIVLVHNALAIILVINAALAAFYHLVSGEIQQFLPKPYGFFNKMFAQARYYLWGIFHNEPHPFDKTPDAKMNPIQQLTYFGLLNVLLPLQVLTGIAMWGAQQWPDVTASLGGLPFLAPFHSLIAWLLATFIVVHVYMTTTGHTPLANIRAMIFGWDEVETHGTESHGTESTGATS